jgi:hypothetical protein
LALLARHLTIVEIDFVRAKGDVDISWGLFLQLFNPELGFLKRISVGHIVDDQRGNCFPIIADKTQVSDLNTVKQ